MFCSAADIYNLLSQDQILQGEGKITFDFLNISIQINEKSAIGDLFQEWLATWMREHDIDFRVSTNTQEFPDFFLDMKSDQKNLGSTELDM